MLNSNVSVGDCRLMVGFYGVSTFVGYLTPNSVYMYIHSRISGWLGFMAYQTFVGYLTSNPFLCKKISSISNNSV